jgi:hypothetical protein
MFALKEQKCVYVSIQIKNVCGSTYNEKQMTRNPSSLTKMVNVNKKIIKKKKKYAHVLLFLIF